MQKPFEGPVLPVLGYLGALGQFGGTRSQSPDFLRILNFHNLNICVLKFAFYIGVND